MALTQIKPAGLSKPVDLADDEKIRLGTGNDLQLYHSASNHNWIDADQVLYARTPEFSVTKRDGTEFMGRFIAEGEVQLYHNNSKKFETKSTGIEVTGSIEATEHITINDSKKLFLGTGNDLEVFHDSTNSWVDNNTGDLYIRNKATNEHLIVQAGAGGNVYLRPNYGENGVIANTNGAVELYYDNVKKLETSSGGAVVSNGTGDAQLNIRGGSSDGRATIQFITDDNAAGSDNFRLRHDANNDFYLQNYSSGSWETNFKAIGDGAVELYYNNSKKFETRDAGATLTGDLYMGDNNVLRLGNLTGGDLKLYHNGTNSYHINKTGYLFVQSDNISLAGQSAGENYLVANLNGSVQLYYDSVKKFETDSSGTTTSGRAYITGTILQGTTDSGEANGDEATFANTSGNAGITIRSAVDNECKIYFSEGTSGGSQYRGAINYNHNTNYMAFSANEYEKMRLLSGGGMTFNGDTASANALDDYEIGSWTPSIANGTFTQYNQAWYIKIGKLVTCYFYIYNFSDTSSSTAFVIGGLPYAYNNSPKHESFFSIEHGGGDGNFNTNFVGLQGRIGQKSTTEVEVRQHRYNSSSQGVEHQHIGSAHLHTTFSYEAA